MPRQLQGPYASFSDAKTPAPIHKGGTDARSSVSAALKLGAIHKSKYNKPGGVLQLDEAGFIPSKYLEEVVSPHSRAIVGPLALLPGVTASYQITDFDSHQVPEISIDAGTATLNGDTINIVAPFNHRNVTLVISGRKITIPIEISAPETPVIISPAQGAESSGSMLISLAPYYAEPLNYSDWVTVPSDVLTSLDFPATTAVIEIQGRKGSSGQAYTSVSGSKYSCGVATTDRRVRLNGEVSALMVASGTGSLKYRLGTPTSLHLSTDWEVATDADFTNIVFGSYENTINLLQIEVTGLAVGTYYTRARHNGQLSSSVPEAPTIVSPVSGRVDHTSSVVFTSSNFITPAVDTHASSDWEVATDPYFKNIYKSVTATVEGKLTWTVSGLMPETQYFARVRHNGTLYSPGVWSQAIKLRTIASYAPIQPSIEHPVNNTVNTKPIVTFESSAYLSPLSEMHLSSDWELARDYAFTTIVRTEVNSSEHLTSWTVTGLSQNTIYFARVRYNAASGLSEWSLPIKIITTANYSPAQPEIVYPLSGTSGFGSSTIVHSSVFSSPIEDPQLSSDWEVARDPDFTTIVVSSHEDTNSLTSWGFGNLLPNTLYFIRVRHRAENGISPWSSTTVIETLPVFSPITPTITRPVMDQIHLATVDTKYSSTVFNSPVGDTHVYSSWQVSTDSDFNTIVEQTLMDQDNLTSWRSTVLLENTGYYVRVKHYGLTHGSTDWSAPIHFTTISLETENGLFRLMAPDRELYDSYGHSVAVSGDTSTLLIGAHREDVETGSVYVYKKQASGYAFQAKLASAIETNGDFFGYSVATSETATVAVVGAPNDDEQHGSAFVFTRSGDSWSQRLKLTANDRGNIVNALSHFGQSVTISKSGNTIAIGAPNANDNSGSVYVYTDTGTTWVQQAKLMAGDAIPGDLFGSVVSLSQDGNTLAVSAVHDDTEMGSTYIFTRSGSIWIQQTKLVASDRINGDHFGNTLALSDTGNTLVIGAVDNNNAAGAAYVFTRSGVVWTQVTKLLPSDAASLDHFGIAVAISGEGNVITVSADNDIAGENIGATYIFCQIGGLWTQFSKLTAFDGEVSDRFGFSLSMSTDASVIAIGAPMVDTEEGAVYTAGFSIAPATPNIVTPTDGITDTTNTVVVGTSAYYSPIGDAHLSSDWQLSTSSDFSAIVVESLDDSSHLLNYSFVNLLPGTHYYARVRHNAGGKKSAWSTAVSFTTLASFAPYAPLLLSPAITAGVMNITTDGNDPFNVTFVTSGLLSPIGASHASTDWEYAADNAFTTLIETEEASSNLVNRVTNIQHFINLGHSLVYYRVRHRDTYGNTSNWSSIAQIVITTP